MDIKQTEVLLAQVAAGTLSPAQAVVLLRQQPFEELGFAKPDLHRAMRQGVGEVIYGAGKTPEQMLSILETLHGAGQERVLITRLSAQAALVLQTAWPGTFAYFEEGQIGISRCCTDTQTFPAPDGTGTILIATGGTSDLPVAEEAAQTAAFLGNRVERLYDVGVAGLHRLLAHTQQIMSAAVIIAIAGMEGALASVIGGLAACPVIAVPTSVGYGASFGGVSALLSMLNSCASGVSVVNIDNGFGAAYQASLINHMAQPRTAAHRTAQRTGTGEGHENDLS